jgi:hypothetical protein
LNGGASSQPTSPPAASASRTSPRRELAAAAPQDYIHRIGRTGRAGAWRRISLVSSTRPVPPWDHAPLRKAIPRQVGRGFRTPSRPRGSAQARPSRAAGVREPGAARRSGGSGDGRVDPGAGRRGS